MTKKLKTPAFAKASAGKQNSMEEVSSTVAKSEDGTIQITFTIPFSFIKTKREEVLKRLSKEVTVPGFRKGKAPVSKTQAQIPENKLLEETLQMFLPRLFADAVNQHKLSPATYPKFDLVKASEGESWQIRATTCEISETELGDYKKLIAGASRSKSIWTPPKGKEPSSAPPSPKWLRRPSKASQGKEEKEQEIIRILLESIKIKMPKILVDEDVNYRLSSLLERIEKLGLSLDSYLASIGKTAETLRAEYEKQARDSIGLTLILNKIAQVENINVEEKEVDKMIETSASNQTEREKFDTPEQRRLIRSILVRRAVLDSLATLI